MYKDSDKIFIAFKNACRLLPKKVFPIYDSLEDAAYHYNLNTKKELLKFIINGGLENLAFLNKNPWENNFTKVKPLFVYAYLFKTGKIPGYIAIINHDKDGVWFIKSFHPPKPHQPETLEKKMKALGL